jgi:hypothetical protein
MTTRPSRNISVYCQASTLRAYGRLGDVLDMSSKIAAENNVACGATWRRGRTLAAQALIEVITRPVKPAGKAQSQLQQVHIRGARITGTLDLEGATVVCPLILEDCYVENRVELRESKLPGLRLPGCFLPEGIDGRGMDVQGSLELNSGFRSGADVLLDAATIGTWVDRNSGHFNARRIAALSANGIRVGADMYCSIKQDGMSDPRVVVTTEERSAKDKESFIANGQVRLARAHISGQLNCAGGSFINPGAVALFADSLKVDGRMVCGPKFRAEGQVYLRRAEVAGQLRFEGTLAKPPDEKAEPQGPNVVWHLEAAKVGRAFAFKPESPFEGEVNLINAKLGYLRDNKYSWPERRYALYGLDFGQIAGPKEQKPNGGWYTEKVNRKGLLRRDQAVTDRLKWLGDERDGYHAHLYDQLAEHYRRIGHEASERRVLINRQWARRKELPTAAKAWNWVSWALLAYGYRSRRTLVAFSILLLAGMLVFDVSGHHHVMNHDDQGQKAPHFSALIYTLDLLLPIINLGQRENWVPTRGWPQFAATALIIAGWVLATMFLAGLSGLVRRTNS